MEKLQLQALNLIIKLMSVRTHLSLICLFTFLFISALILNSASAQNTTTAKPLPPTPFRVGERLTYNFTFGNFKNAGYAEIYVVSRGKLGEKDAVELRSKAKTSDLVSAAFYLLDEARTTFAESGTGLPLYIRNTSNASVLPKETVKNYTVNQSSGYDWLTLVYQARNSGGVGNFALQEDDRIYSVSFQNTGSQRIKTDAGEFETKVSTVQSQFLAEKGITDFRINFSDDELRIPVLFRFKTAKGNFRGDLASIQIIEPNGAPETSPTPIPTPLPQTTPKPAVTPTPYIENEPLSKDLPFTLGETLEYQVSTIAGQYIGNVTLQAKERKQFTYQSAGDNRRVTEDSLVLTATVTGTQPGQQILRLNDSITANVNPESLSPQQIILRFSGLFSAYSQTVQFNQRTGKASINNANQIDIPVGTHSVLSLVYAARSFNLKPSKDATNPVNDTRVAVLLGSESYVFRLRPSNAEILTQRNERVSAQLIAVSTGNPQFDQLGIRLWLSTDEKRLPLRLTFGSYQADLISEKLISPK
jgi:hypothetical protein